MEVVLIKHYWKYDDVIEEIGIASSMEIAKKYVEKLKSNWYYSGRFEFSTFNVIDHIKE